MRISEHTRKNMEQIHLMKIEGVSCREIGKRIGLCAARVNQLWNRYQIVKSQEASGFRDDPLSELSARTANCLYNWNILSKEDALKAVTSGKLTMRHRPRNFGKGSFEEVIKWLGIDSSKLQTGTPCRCPHCNAVFFR